MRILLDDRDCALAADSVGGAIAAAAAVAEGSGRLIVEVIVDGRPWSCDELTTSSQHEAEEIRLTSADTNELVSQTLGDAAEALVEADRLQQTAAELLQRGDHAAAMNELNMAISIWQSVQQAVSMSCDLRRLDLHQPGNLMGGRERPIIEVVAELSEGLRQLRESISRADWLAVADSLMYELPQTLRSWQNLLLELQADSTA